MRKVLLVDDLENKLEQLIGVVKLASKDANLCTVGSYTEAINEIRYCNFDLIITDMVMDDIDSGFKILKASKQKNFSTKVIIVTDYENPKLEAQSFSDGAFDYIKRDSFTFVNDLCNRLNEVF